MDIQFSCSKCGQHIAVDESGAGLTVQCPSCSQNLVVPAPAARAVATPGPKEVQTNVKQGALIGGWVCFVVTAICLIAPFPTFFLWIPLAFAAFVLSIVAMSQKRVVGGLALLLVTIIAGPILWLYGASGAVKNFSEQLKTSTHATAQSLKTVSESPVTDNTSVPVQTATQTIEPSEHTTGTPAAPTPSETKASTQAPTALDAKGGFREYRLGAKRTDINSELSKTESTFGGKDEDTDKYQVETFDHLLGSFQLEGIILEFDHTLGILKDVTVYVDGKQNIAGVLEAFKAAYGEPVKESFISDDYQWTGTDIKLRYHTGGFGDSAWASWTSKRVNKLIEAERDRRAKEGATDAVKGL